MKYAIKIWEDWLDIDFEIVTEEGHLYGFHHKEADDYGGLIGEICERRFSFNKNLLYNPENAWEDTQDIKEYSTDVPEQPDINEAMWAIFDHIGVKEPICVSIEEINSIIAKIEDTI